MRFDPENIFKKYLNPISSFKYWSDSKDFNFGEQLSFNTEFKIDIVLGSGIGNL